MDRQRDKEISREIHRLFWRAILQSKKILAITLISRVLAVSIYNIFIPLITAYAIQAIITRHFEIVNRYALWIILLAVAYAIFWSIGEIVSKLVIKGAKYVQNTVFTNFLNKDYEFYGNTYFGSLGAQAAQFRETYILYDQLFIHLIPKQLTIILAGIIVIAYHSLLLAVVTLVAMAAVLSFTVWSSSWRLRFRRQLAEASSHVAGSVGDALTHATTVKTFANEGSEKQILQSSLARWAREQYKSWFSSLPADAGRMILAAIATALLLVLSARLYRDGTITITIVILIQLYVIRLVASTFDIAEMVKSYESIMGAAYSPMKTMLIPQTIKDPVKPVKLRKTSNYRLELSQVTYQYPEAAKSQKAVQNFSLTIKPGEKVGIVGYSGSGKTTLTKLLLRFMDVSKGNITINGVDLRDLAQADVRSVISYVPQEPLLFHRSILENIGYGKLNASRRSIIKAAKVAYVDEFVTHLPKKYDTLVGERGVKLSGGQRQRVAIARALLKDSPILVLDEATSALDSKSEKFIQDALWKLMKDRTAIVIAHRLSTIQRMDKIIVMDKGKIVQADSHQKLKNQPGIYADLWKHQSGGYIGVPTFES